VLVRETAVSEPNGRESIDPEPSYVHELIMRSQERYWYEGAGQMGIDFRHDERKTVLILTPVEHVAFTWSTSPNRMTRIGGSRSERRRRGRVSWSTSEGRRT
jgi:hypothetical protein